MTLSVRLMTGHVRKKGDFWYYSFELKKINNKRQRIEKKGGATKKEAEKALRSALKEFEDEDGIIKESLMSISEYFEYWYQEYVLLNCKYNTQTHYKNLIINHINPTLGYSKLKKITPRILQDFINNKYLSGMSKNSLEVLKSTLSGAFKYAVFPCEFIKENPVQFIKLPRYKNIKLENKEKLISQEDFEKIMLRFDENSSFYIPLIIGYYTGARISEVFALTWEDINFEEQTLSINKQILKKGKYWHFETTKSYESNRIIKIGDTLINVLRNHKESQLCNSNEYGEFYGKYYELAKIDKTNSQRRIVKVDYNTGHMIGKELSFLCTKENGAIVTPESFKYASRVIHYELNINFSFHFFRHTHATILLENGATFKGVQNRLGHDCIETTLNIYAHVTKKAQSETADIFERNSRLLIKK